MGGGLGKLIQPSFNPCHHSHWLKLNTCYWLRLQSVVLQWKSFYFFSLYKKFLFCIFFCFQFVRVFSTFAVFVVFACIRCTCGKCLHFYHVVGVVVVCAPRNVLKELERPSGCGFITHSPNIIFRVVVI